MSVSVIIPCHSEGELLRRAVVSALPAGEVVIVGDGIDEATLTVANELMQGFSNVRFISTRMRFPVGVCTARNWGIQNAVYDLIIPLDADDMFLRGGIEALETHWTPDVWCYPSYQEYKLGIGHIRDVQAPPPGMLSRKNIAQAVMCFSKTQWEAALGYDVDFSLGCEDHALQCALTQAGYTPLRVDILCYAYTLKDDGRAARCLRYADAIKRLLKEKYPTVFEK